MYKNLRFVYVTTSSRDEARKIGRTIVEEKLAACVNIIDHMESIYVWEGKVEEANECVLIVKTHYSRIRKLTRRIKEMHSYDCPCVLSITVAEDEGNQEYLDWLENTAKQTFHI